MKLSPAQAHVIGRLKHIWYLIFGGVPKEKKCLYLKVFNGNDYAVCVLDCPNDCSVACDFFEHVIGRE